MEPYFIREAEETALPVVASIPHGGTWLPPGYAERLANDEMRALPMTDWHMPRLFEFLPSLGVTVIAANVSRFVIDLNRPPDGVALYPGRFETGLVPLDSFDGQPIFSDPPTVEDIEKARREIYERYHAARWDLLRRRAEGGRVIQLDLHSVTPVANRISGPLVQDIMLGDREGTSCEGWLTEAAEEAYSQGGFTVTRNEPYKGGWITASCVGEPWVQALQIEMNWAVYMDLDLAPAAAADAPPFVRAQERLRDVFARLAPGAARYLRAG